MIVTIPHFVIGIFMLIAGLMIWNPVTARSGNRFKILISGLMCGFALSIIIVSILS